MTQDTTAEAPKKGKKKLFMIIGAVVVLVGGGFGAMTFLGGGEDEPEWAEDKPKEGAVLDVSTLTSTLSGEASLARVGLAVVASEGAVEADIVAKFPLLKDATVSELARTTPDTLRTAEGADQLRKRLTKESRKIYPDGEVLRVLLTELVVQ